MIDVFGAGEYFIEVAGETIKFEWSEHFGPAALTKKGEIRDLKPQHPFWRAASIWNLQGQRLDGDKQGVFKMKKPAYWALYTGIGLYALAAISHFGMQWFRYDLHNGEPRAHFYSQAAYDNCAGMSAEAKERGAAYWTCHKPQP